MARFLRLKKAGQVSTLREAEPSSVSESEDDPFAEVPL